MFRSEWSIGLRRQVRELCVERLDKSRNQLYNDIKEMLWDCLEPKKIQKIPSGLSVPHHDES